MGKRPEITTDKDVQKKMVDTGQNLANQIKKGDNPAITLPVRNLNNVYFDKESKTIKLGDKTSQRQFLNIAHVRKFMQTTLVANEVNKVLAEKATVSIRDLYYAMKHTIPGTQEESFSGQEESDPLIEDLEAALDLLRENMNLIATPKGRVAGNIQVKDGKDTIDATKMGSSGWAVPSNVEPEKIEIKDVDAEYILFVEKFAVWNRFNEDAFWKKNKCLIVTSNGQPARAERRLVQRLFVEHGIPTYCLMDADPWGMYIYSVIKQGSISLSYSEDRLANPTSKYIGLTISDVEKFKIPKEVTIKLNQGDLARIKQMKDYEWFKKKEWQQELDLMKEKGYKLELEALSRKRIRFITEEYVPQKIKNNDFLS